MNPNVRIATPDRYDDMVDFANYVFGEDFRQIVPRIYLGHPELAKQHYIAEEASRIKGMVLCYRNAFHMGDRTLKLAGIGTVSVHPYARRRGYMKDVMNQAVEDARADGVDLMELGGQRQRYEHFGFTPCGAKLTMTLSEGVVRRVGNIDHSAFSIRPLTPEADVVAQCKQLHDQQPVHANRDAADFITICNTWANAPYIVSLDGAFFGYIVGTTDRVAEIVLMDETRCVEVLFAYIAHMGSKSLSVHPAHFQSTLIDRLNAICEDRSIASELQFNVLNYRNVIEAALRFAHGRVELMPGALVLDIEGHGRYALTVAPEGATVCETDAAPDRSLGHLQAMEYLFSPMTPLGCARVTALERSWFPLMLAVSPPDQV